MDKVVMRLQRKQTWWFWAILSFGYFLTHWLSLTALPVFADESIYIRWAQLILDDPQRYWFFAMNDGKTPLFIWLLSGFQLLFQDQLWAGRWLAVIIGFGQVLANGYLVAVLGGNTRARRVVMVMTAILPFWFFHHRMALIDGLLCLTLTLFFTALIRVVTTPLKNSELSMRNLLPRGPGILLAGLGLGLSLWTKVPAILILPVAGLVALYPANRNIKERANDVLSVGVAVGIGLAIFASLRISPVFGQLFSRGGDFLFGWQEIVGGRWKETIPSIPTYIGYFWQYAHPVTVLLFVASLFSRRHSRAQHLLFWSAVAFALPIAVMGRVVYARYLLPVMIFMTIGAWMYWEELLTTYSVEAKSLLYKATAGIILAMLLANVVGTAGLFAFKAWTNPDELPLVESDRVQYLAEWSSGHGIIEARDFIQAEAKTTSVAVATEGFFGTLPDGLLLYFHRRPTDNIYIEGIGQPVRSIPDFFEKKALPYQKHYLVVNSHRMLLQLDSQRLVKEYCRPFNAPCLQIWDITGI